ncbi:hypothetical protein M3Y97_00588600 [Aphelenchoides bicaudatus]|nr:hypothetical protein M3Y97_00588600 [Aphelenchoides bicaudatus]
MTAVYNKSQMFSLFFMLISKVFIQSAFNILYIFTSELSPTNVRNSALGVYSMIGRIGSGASSYLAILSDVTLAVVPMIIFAIFSLIAGILVIFLPETKGLPLPETFADALLLTKNSNGKYGFYGLSENKSSVSLVGKESGDGTSTIVPPIADPENQIQAEKGSTGSSLARRSETFTELAPITEDHEEGLHEPDSDRPKSSRSITPTQADFDAPGNLSRRQRHAAGSVERKVSAIEVSTDLFGKQEKDDKTTKFLISSSSITDD